MVFDSVNEQKLLEGLAERRIDHHNSVEIKYTYERSTAKVNITEYKYTNEFKIERGLWQIIRSFAAEYAK